jgi:DNA-binding XRE family transcriptional regulator
MTMGEHMQSAREQAGLSLRELARLSGVHRQTIRYAEKDICNTNIFNIICLADVLKISVD